jgi:hypothetical protein
MSTANGFGGSNGFGGWNLSLVPPTDANLTSRLSRFGAQENRDPAVSSNRSIPFTPLQFTFVIELSMGAPWDGSMTDENGGRTRRMVPIRRMRQSYQNWK